MLGSSVVDQIKMEIAGELNSSQDSALSADVPQQQQLSTMVADEVELYAMHMSEYDMSMFSQFQLW